MARVPAKNSNGLLLLMAGAAVDSTSGLFTRLTELNGFAITSGRGVFAFLFLLSILVWRDGRNSWKTLTGVGASGVAVVLLNACGMFTNVLSLKLTAVANFFMIFATAPFVAAIAAWAILGERLDKATLLAAVAGFAGIIIMMVSGANSGGLLGDLLACACVGFYSSIILVMRRAGTSDILPLMCLTSLCTSVAGAPLADFAAITGKDVTVLAAMGIIQLAIGNLLIFRAVSLIPAAQSGLLGILDAAFAPVWVFAVFGEIPPRATLIGGAIILGAALAHLAYSLTLPARSRENAVPQRP